MDWIALAGLASLVLAFCQFFGVRWLTVRYRFLRFSEYPQITRDTPPTAAVVFAAHSLLATGLSFLVGVTFLAMFGYVMLHTETPYRPIAAGEMLIASAVMLWSANRAGGALDRAYRVFFPIDILDEQLQQRGHSMPDELKGRRDAR